MKKALTRKESTIYHYKDGKRIEGAPEGVTGNLTGITGNLFGITGDLFGIRGDLTGIRGDLDDCDITPEERERGISIEDLIK